MFYNDNLTLVRKFVLTLSLPGRESSDRNGTRLNVTPRSFTNGFDCKRSLKTLKSGSRNAEYILEAMT